MLQGVTLYFFVFVFAYRNWQICPSQMLQSLPESSRNCLEFRIPIMVVDGDSDGTCRNLTLVKDTAFFTRQSVSVTPHQRLLETSQTCSFKKMMIKT